MSNNFFTLGEFILLFFRMQPAQLTRLLLIVNAIPYLSFAAWCSTDILSTYFEMSCLDDFRNSPSREISGSRIINEKHIILTIKQEATYSRFSRIILDFGREGSYDRQEYLNWIFRDTYGYKESNFIDCLRLKVKESISHAMCTKNFDHSMLPAALIHNSHNLHK